MPYRKTPIVKDEVYHVFNRSIAKQPIFLNVREYQRALEVFKFYQYSRPPLRYSFFNRLPKAQREQFLKQLESTNKIVEIICFCIMPNHFHFLIRGLTETGSQNSYAKYFNIKNDRTGSLFQPMFKAVRIESDEQLVHVSRYIHLNPITSYLIETKDLNEYPWSSYSEYINNIESFIKKNLILNFFKSAKDYEKFVLDQVEYQRELDKIKHLVLE
ncbi:MAG: hypothetical protein G01um101493_239 [Microgenomates group bacterium Gr01-1014_93]|nr:MAG: hypothetical protein G01um101493_239 [Microgenomates group bacterium Gr01-1014_93]